MEPHIAGASGAAGGGLRPEAAAAAGALAGETFAAAGFSPTGT